MRLHTKKLLLSKSKRNSHVKRRQLRLLKLRQKARHGATDKEKRSKKKQLYWLDACEDVSCNDYFAECEPVSATSIPELESRPREGCHDRGFFGGIDKILESLKNGDAAS